MKIDMTGSTKKCYLEMVGSLSVKQHIHLHIKKHFDNSHFYLSCIQCASQLPNKLYARAIPHAIPSKKYEVHFFFDFLTFKWLRRAF